MPLTGEIIPWSDADIDIGHLPPHGVLQGLPGAAGHTAVGGDQQGAVVHQIAVAPLDAAGLVAVLDQGLVVALPQDRLPSACWP